MGFQGDVAGLGLGELLQGLARGGREGVLTLHGSGANATLGVQNGQLFLLPEPHEDPEMWRKRSERAWVKDPNERIDTLRMSEIAYAARLERMFELLDSEGVHFRFEAGPLPTATPSTDTEPAEIDLDKPPARQERIEAKVPVHCPGISVEFLLLEHARLDDECQGAGDSRGMSVHEVPRLMGEALARASERLFAECDGISNIGEIGDRLAWPLRQTKAVVQQQVARSMLRLSTARELLVLASRELEQNRFARAASRLSGWVHKADPGPPPAGDAELLLHEWQGGKLAVVLASMPPRDSRRLLRRMEWVEQDVKSAIARWNEHTQHHRHDLIAELCVLRWQMRSENEAAKPSVSDILKLARNLQDASHNARAGVLLRMAATRLPGTTSTRLELGLRMLAVGLVEEGTPWVLEACRTLIDSNLAEKALAPMRQLIAAAPSNREARALMGEARARSAKGKLRKRNSIIALSIVLLIALGGLVQLRLDQDHDRRLSEIAENIDRPELALRMLQEEFAGDSSARVRSLHELFVDRLKKNQTELRNGWLERYRECELECTLGDPLLGLQRTLDLPKPPDLTEIKDPFPPISDVLGQLAARLEQSAGELGEKATQGVPQPADMHAEQRLLRQIEDIAAMAASRPHTDELVGFQQRVRGVLDLLRLRDETRATARAADKKQTLVAQQDLLLAAARAHAQAGDLERAVQTFHRLVELEGSETLGKVLAREIGEVQAHLDAVHAARKLAAEGKHAEALAELAKICPNPAEHLLPWHVDSVPTGARAHFSDGSTRVAPFVVETAPGEHVDFTFELAGYETMRIESDNPADVSVVMSRTPERWWRTTARVDAAPVAVEDDHVVCDRTGAVARLSPAVGPRWAQHVDSLGGVARAPVFLPKRPGCLLLVTEDGQAWLVEADGGKLEGPWEIGSPPIDGPTATGRTVEAHFADGRAVTWEARLKPESTSAIDDHANVRTPGETAATAFGSSAGMEILRRRTNPARSLVSPWSDWIVDVESTRFNVHKKGTTEGSFFVRRQGEWVYVAWEAPHARAPQGRLWVSDAAGLRAFEP